MNEGDRVRLVEQFLEYEAGSEGVVDSVILRPDQTLVNVSIDNDANGDAVDPPDPISPQEESFFVVIG